MTATGWLRPAILRPVWVIPWLKALCVTLLILFMQGPAMLTQEIAWAGMLVRYTQQRGLKQGVVETFDGRHPCPMCLKAKKIREEERRKDPMDDGNRKQRQRLAWMEMLAATEVEVPGAPVKEWQVVVPVGNASADGRGAEAPEPPPPERIV